MEIDIVHLERHSTFIGPNFLLVLLPFFVEPACSERFATNILNKFHKSVYMYMVIHVRSYIINSYPYLLYLLHRID